MRKPTEREIAGSWSLWQEYVDPQATMTESDFDNMSFDECLAMIHDCFGCDGTCENNE